MTHQVWLLKTPTVLVTPHTIFKAQKSLNTMLKEGCMKIID